MYWDYYYKAVDCLIATYPDKIRIFQKTDLNDALKVDDLLEFLEFNNKTVIPNIQRNKIEKNIFDKIKRKLFGA